MVVVAEVYDVALCSGLQVDNLTHRGPLGGACHECAHYALCAPCLT